MDHLVCLSLAPNLRCFGFTRGQFTALIIPPAIEFIISLFFAYLYPGPRRWTQVLAADGILYFIWALLDTLSHVISAARASFSIFRVLDFVVGAVSFTPILFYSIYLYQLSFRDFIPTLPRKLQPYLEILIPILLGMTIALNEVSSFVGTYLGTTPNQLVVVRFLYDNESLWFSLSRSSLAMYTFIQFLFMLLAFSRVSRAFLEQRRIELTHADEHHYFNGIIWITAGIVIGLAEAIPGFFPVSFGAVLSRRILRLVARAILMFGLLKGLDMTDNFENLTEELCAPPLISERISRVLGISPRRNAFRRMSHSNSEASRVDEYPITRRQRREERVTVHYEKGQAPFLQIRFSALDFPAQDALPDTTQRRRWSLSGPNPGHAGAASNQHEEKDDPDDMTATRSTVLEATRAKSALVTTSNHHYVLPDWPLRPPRTRQDSGGNVSDNQSIIRDLERKFPSLPPRVTGRYRGSILGQNYEDPFPVVGVSRQPSLHHEGGANNPSEEGGVSVTVSSSGSIKRKPAPPLLENIAYTSDHRKRLASSWGGLVHPSEYPVDSLNSPSRGISSTPAGESSTPRSRRMTARNVFRRASRALSDASVRSAEWLASASTLRSARTPLTASDIEMYHRLGPGSARPIGEASSPGDLPKPSRKSADDLRVNSKPRQPRSSVGI